MTYNGDMKHASVFVLLSLAAAMNASQAMVLCVGCDGHGAIEPAGHDHCADGTHRCESDAAAHDTRLTPDASGAGCRGCTDIPLADAIGSDPSASARGGTAAAFAGVLPAQIPPFDNFESGNPKFEFAPVYHVPLRSVMLQV
jgi:hypothetical protein